MDNTTTSAALNSISIVLNVPEWTASQRRGFMDEFSNKMEQLAPSFWSATLVRMPRDMAVKIDENPGDEKAVRLSFSPGYNGDPLRISLRPNVPHLMNELTRSRVEQELTQLQEKVSSDWMVNYLMPTVGWFLRIPKEDRKPENIVEEIVKKERQRLEPLVPQESARQWMAYASTALFNTVLLASHSALSSLNLDKPIAPLLVEGNGRTVSVSFENLTESQVPDPQDGQVPPSPAKRATLQA